MADFASIVEEKLLNFHTTIPQLILFTTVLGPQVKERGFTKVSNGQSHGSEGNYGARNREAGKEPTNKTPVYNAIWKNNKAKYLWR